jgi:hypothetical protein
MYRKKHREKLGIVEKDKPNEEPAEEVHQHDPALDPIPTQENVTLDLPKPAQSTMTLSKKSISQTTATDYVHRPAPPSVMSSAAPPSNVSGINDNHIEVPPAPEGEGEFECPYCYFLLDQRFHMKRNWEYEWFPCDFNFVANNVVKGSTYLKTSNHTYAYSTTAPSLISFSKNMNSGLNI